MPDLRLVVLNGADMRRDGDLVLYWMIASRRRHWNFGLQRAVGWARELDRPLVILEALRCDYQWASDRMHAFVLQGMADNRRAFADAPVYYHPYVEPTGGAGRGLLEALARHAAVVVTDDYPAFFLRRMTAAAASRLDVRLEAVDSNGLLPLRATERPYPTAFAFRLFLQKNLRPHLAAFPEADPLHEADLPRSGIPTAIARRWPAATDDLLAAAPAALAHLPIDHAVPPVSTVRGGDGAGMRAVETFLDDRLRIYAGERNQPEREVTSGLSPYLHFGHVSVHGIFERLMTRERWTTRRLGTAANGKREGWWGASAAAESFLDELITWREVGYNMCHHRSDCDRFESLPDWARATLEEHAADRRTFIYSLDQFESASTHDPLWNAAQQQLRREGRIHNYLRMLWGKKILEWSASPRDALAIMIELNNKYALDGRDPNSYAGICWTLGRYDRPWAPVRPIFGSIRYMSSENTARKVRVKSYIRTYTEPGSPGLFPS